MHGIKPLTVLLSLTALACLSHSSSSSSVLATEVVPNVAFMQRNLLDYSRSAAEKSKAAQVQFALAGTSSNNSFARSEFPAVHNMKRRCKKKAKKHHTKKLSNSKKHQQHHHHHHHDHHHNHKGDTKTSTSTATDEKCSAEDDNENTTTDEVSLTSTKNELASTNNDKISAVKTVSDVTSSISSSLGNVTSSNGSGSYQRVQQNRGSNFWSGGNWQFWSYSDPTHGQVKFASESSAKSQGLIGMKNGAAFMRASNKDINGGNRPSVRFQSKKAFDSGLIIFDVAKMPVGCATWPALWTTKGDAWPYNGEIDVVEGVGYTSGNKNANQMTVHLGQNSPLSMRKRGVEKRASSYAGKVLSKNCNQWGGSTGCAFLDSNAHGPSWGADFNAAGGGIWAMQFGNGNGVKIWFWGRKSGLIPSELSKANISPEKLDPTSWGTPMGNFQSSVINNKITAQNIIMDITIAGDWAGNVPMDGHCKGQSLHEAIKKGSNFNDAEFILNGVDIYCKNGKC